MITVKINEEKRKLEDIDPSWINQQINRRIADGITVCVNVSIDEQEINLVLSTPTCGRRKSGGRRPNKQEKKVIDLWTKFGLNKSDFRGGNLIAFLKQFERI